jgi:hypothetical protein
MDERPVVSVVVIMVGDEAGKELTHFLGELLSCSDLEHNSPTGGSRLTGFSIIPSSFGSSAAYSN